MHASNWKKKATKKNKNNFINIIRDKFAMNIRREKLTISFSKKHFSCINYLQLFICGALRDLVPFCTI